MINDMRSILETINSMVKRRFGAPLRKRLESRKVTETRLKLVAHDIRRVGYIEILAGAGTGVSVNFVPKPGFKHTIPSKGLNVKMFNPNLKGSERKQKLKGLTKGGS